MQDFALQVRSLAQQARKHLWAWVSARVVA